MYKIQTAFDSPIKIICLEKTSFVDLGVTDDVTGEVKSKIFRRSQMFYGMLYNIE